MKREGKTDQSQRAKRKTKSRKGRRRTRDGEEKKQMGKKMKSRAHIDECTCSSSVAARKDQNQKESGDNKKKNTRE